ncbi:hypothetical protein GUITHDRAFT_114508 [Guillardia theta CCMP2712]|uniref:Uncharacterized protein n=2 Tax=Guillardia theta TaxID=55529 RepID=L1IU14_GUITC|nr:hypothetical protein GUITHDRAFT_114508 [Guillardia theta CCMP2712]EKX39305.1 hypothetical protein GUITHDRAFT_114508 [Guillardia theta CCMP2712]|mmetsp:Transcript_21886/g.72302  ORF Transcript_21886/g.72302 Transcript_21886/m.72302 type:complete len:466 (+) Transcript_21886:328-1725(+)|eukprot:XP_005826285.1 hypothetical protein GUITHDRAFT_114508 [Guillardia theta CCMP2712]
MMRNEERPLLSLWTLLQFLFLLIVFSIITSAILLVPKVCEEELSKMMHSAHNDEWEQTQQCMMKVVQDMKRKTDSTLDILFINVKHASLFWNHVVFLIDLMCVHIFLLVAVACKTYFSAFQLVSSSLALVTSKLSEQNYRGLMEGIKVLMIRIGWIVHNLGALIRATFECAVTDECILTHSSDSQDMPELVALVQRHLPTFRETIHDFWTLSMDNSTATVAFKLVTGMYLTYITVRLIKRLCVLCFCFSCNVLFVMIGMQPPFLKRDTVEERLDESLDISNISGNSESVEGANGEEDGEKGEQNGDEQEENMLEETKKDMETQTCESSDVDLPVDWHVDKLDKDAVEPGGNEEARGGERASACRLSCNGSGTADYEIEACDDRRSKCVALEVMGSYLQQGRDAAVGRKRVYDKEERKEAEKDARTAGLVVLLLLALSSLSIIALLLVALTRELMTAGRHRLSGLA